MSDAARRTREPWAIVVAIGTGLIAVALLVFLIGLFVPSPGAQLASMNIALTIGVLGAIAAAVGVTLRLIRR